MKALQEPRTLSVTLILGAETFKAGEGCPSPREGQLSPCAYHLSHSLSSIHWRPPCPQVLDHSAPHPAQSGWRRAQHLHHSSPGMVVQAGGSFPPLLPHSLLCPQCPQPKPRHAVPGLTCLTVPARSGARRAAHSDTSPGMLIQTCSHTRGEL